MRSPYRRATTLDLDRLLLLQRDFYAEQQYPFDADVMRHAWPRLLSDCRVGQAWIAEDDADAVAYVVATLGYSLEHQGRDAFVDELYVAPSHRGRGLGRAALEQVERWCRHQCVRVLLLEVEDVNDDAHALYTRAGFVAGSRHLLRKTIGGQVSE